MLLLTMAAAVYQNRGTAVTECSAEAMPSQAVELVKRVPVVSMAKRLAAVPVSQLMRAVQSTLARVAKPSCANAAMEH